MKRRCVPQLAGFLAAISFALLLPQSQTHSARRTPVESTDYVEEGEDPLTRAHVAFYRDFLVRNPDIELIPFRSLHLPPAILPARRSRLLFTMLGDAGPDHIISNLEDSQLLSDQNFLYPLDEYIFDVLKDKSGHPVDPDGRPLDPTKEELFYRDRLTGKYSVAVPIGRRCPVSPEWENIPELFRAASIRDGRVCGLPVLDGFTCLIYRRDLFASAGLDPDSPPPDWDAFIYCAQKLTEPDKPIRAARVQKGQYGFACAIDPSQEWLNYLWQVGGDAVHRIKFCPVGHRVEAKKDAEFPPKCPRCGKSLLRSRQSWAPAFNCDAGVVALKYYSLLRSLRWTRCPRCGEPVNVPARTVKPVMVACSGPKGCGHLFPYPQASRIYRGVVREVEAEGFGFRVSGFGARGTGSGDRGSGVGDRGSGVGDRGPGSGGRRLGSLQTPDPRPQTPNPRPQTPDPKPQTPNPRPQATDRANLLVKLFERGEVAMVMVTGPYRFITNLSLPAENIGMMPLPGGWQWVECPRCGEPIILTSEMKASGRAVCRRDLTSVNLVGRELRGGLSANLINVKMWGMNFSSPKATRDAVWQLIEHRMSDEGNTFGVLASWREKEEGGDLLQSRKAAKRGAGNLVEQHPASRGASRLAPWAPHWSAFMTTEMRELLRRACTDEKVDLRAALAEAAEKCAATIGTERPTATHEQKKGVSGILVPLAILVLLAVRWLYKAIGSQNRHSGATPATVGKRRVLAWLLLAPALILLILWVWLPLLRGTEMAFSDWRAAGEKRFLGVVNFASILSSPEFWHVLLQTIMFVGLSLALGFGGPIILALLLAEVPRGKHLLRTIFYLPALTSGLAVALLWKLMYEPTETGFLNWLLLHMPRTTYLILPFLVMVAFAALSALFFRRREFVPGVVLLILSAGLILLIPRIQPLRRPINWLGNPAAGGLWTMVCVILPAAWASAGPGSLIYLAALRSIPAQLYESADLDGAGVFAKIRHITLAELRPLVTINLVGALVGTSQAIRNIFVLTGGQPDGRTKVLALDVWYNAFIYLRFGYVTALAWILASMIIGFAVYQLRRFLRADFRRLPVERNAVRLCAFALKNTGVGNAETQRRGGRGQETKKK